MKTSSTVSDQGTLIEKYYNWESITLTNPSKFVVISLSITSCHKGVTVVMVIVSHYWMILVPSYTRVTLTDLWPQLLSNLYINPIIQPVPPSDFYCCSEESSIIVPDRLVSERSSQTGWDWEHWVAITVQSSSRCKERHVQSDFYWKTVSKFILEKVFLYEVIDLIYTFLLWCYFPYITSVWYIIVFIF